MYLFVFVFILLTIIGVFTQVFAMQTARIFGDMKVGAEQMLIWHAAAVTTAKENVSIGQTAAGCTLLDENNAVAPAPPLPAACSVRISCDILPPTSPPCTSLQIRKFDSIVFTNGLPALRMIVTFVSPGVDASDPRPPTGFTNSQLMRQLLKTKRDPLSMGVVNGTTMIPPGQITVQYPTPSGTSVPSGSVAIYSLL